VLRFSPSLCLKSGIYIYIYTRIDILSLTRKNIIQFCTCKTQYFVLLDILYKRVYRE